LLINNPTLPQRNRQLNNNRDYPEKQTNLAGKNKTKKGAILPQILTREGVAGKDESANLCEDGKHNDLLISHSGRSGKSLTISATQLGSGTIEINYIVIS